MSKHGVEFTAAYPEQNDRHPNCGGIANGVWNRQVAVASACLSEWTPRPDNSAARPSYPAVAAADVAAGQRAPMAISFWLADRRRLRAEIGI